MAIPSTFANALVSHTVSRRIYSRTYTLTIIGNHNQVWNATNITERVFDTLQHHEYAISTGTVSVKSVLDQFCHVKCADNRTTLEYKVFDDNITCVFVSPNTDDSASEKEALYVLRSKLTERGLVDEHTSTATMLELVTDLALGNVECYINSLKEKC